MGRKIRSVSDLSHVNPGDELKISGGANFTDTVKEVKNGKIIFTSGVETDVAVALGDGSTIEKK